MVSWLGMSDSMKWFVDGKVRNPITTSSDLIDAKFEEHQCYKFKRCPACNYQIERQQGIQDWPGLPSGVKFDPTDQELIEHLQGKIGVDNCIPHPLIDQFIPTIEGEDGICYTHPEKLPGISRDGLIRHFFHRPSKAYTTGTRKRRKIQTDCDEQGGETRWHKTGKTRPVMIQGRQKGCKKILVLYTNFGKHRKPEKTNWVMHQYHLGCQEEEKEGELVVSKVFYQTQPRQCSWDKAAESGDAAASALKAASAEITDNPKSSPVVNEETVKICAESSERQFHVCNHLEQQRKASYSLSLVPSGESSDQGINSRENKSSETNSQGTPQCSGGVNLNKESVLKSHNHSEMQTTNNESQQQDEGHSGLDVTTLLRCHETLVQVGALSGTNFLSYDSQNMEDLAAELGLTLDDHHPQRSRIINNNNGVPPQKINSLEDIFMDTPAEIKEEPLSTSQETEWLKYSFWTDSDNTGPLDRRLI
ncbi:hypothetical protein KI387_026378 [Taxus chinensis]|uniref:NAC domain-containing protein n=1 Tax=Taxus chinensis TaxID=29808 RepID=A0AA38KZ38_TAXCH|nr:hypothetical protein KI387_026378 [Taxus chinensis]